MRKEQVCITHKDFGIVEIVDAWGTVSNESQHYFVVKNPEAFSGEKKILTDNRYWLDESSELDKIFRTFFHTHEETVRKKLAREYAKDRAAAKLALKQQLAMQEYDSKENNLEAVEI